MYHMSMFLLGSVETTVWQYTNASKMRLNVSGVKEGESSSDLSNKPICYSDLPYHVLFEFQFVVDCDPKVPLVRERPKCMGHPDQVYR